MARLAVGPTVDTLQVRKGSPSRMDDFGGLKITKIVASRPKCGLDVARCAPDVHFADSVEELSILQLRDRGAHFGIEFRY